MKSQQSRLQIDMINSAATTPGIEITIHVKTAVEKLHYKDRTT